MHAKEYFAMMRPLNCLMASLAVFIGASVAKGMLNSSFLVVLAMASAFLICGAGQAINSYFDYEVDRKKKNEKAEIIEKLGRNNVLYYSLILFASGNIVAWQINSVAFLIAVAFSILLIAYSAFMGKIKYIGNWVVASGTAATLFFGASVEGKYFLATYFAFAALFANAAREIIKDFEDEKADMGFKKSLPMLFGEKAKYFVSVLYSAAFITGMIPWFFGLVKSQVYAALVLASGIIFLLSMLALKENDYAKAQKLSKMGMLAALIAFLASVLT